jgi:hypothetical protein
MPPSDPYASFAGVKDDAVVGERDLTPNEPVAVRKASHGSEKRIGFVHDLADDLLDQALDGDDANHLNAAVLAAPTVSQGWGFLLASVGT